MRSYLDTNGTWHHKFRQSWLKTADLCPEQARQEHEKMFEDIETDAASVGSAVHHAIEGYLRNINDGDTSWGIDAGYEWFEEDFERRVNLPNFRWVKYSPAKALAFGRQCVKAWYHHAYPTLLDGDALLEHTFQVNLCTTPERIIDLSGTIDYVGAEGHHARLKDWKTSGRGPYTEWEHKRWSIQASVYTLAAVELDLVETEPDGTVPFEFVVMGDHGVQRFTVNRGPAEWQWLFHKCQAYAELIEAQVPVWPLQDNHVLCSPKWCPAWSTCKGATGIEY